MEQLRHSDRPRTVYLELLYGCNLRCTYCYVGSERNHRNPIVPPLETTLRILRTLREIGVQEIVLLGGEPTLSPFLHEVCRAIADLAFPFRGIVTNGTALTQEKAVLLKETDFWVDVSFRGPSSSVFDSVAAKGGSFYKALNSCLVLSELGVRLGIEYDCIPQNYDTLYETVEMLVEAGAKIRQLQLHRIMPEGDARINFSDFLLQPHEWDKVFEQAARIQTALGIQVVFEDGFPLCLVDPKYWQFIVPCGCGFSLLTVGPTGDVRSCPCQQEVLGNILEGSLQSIWQISLQKYRSPDRHAAACLSCDLLEICRGGCSASGRGVTADANDIYVDFFRSVRLDKNDRPTAKRILGQGLSLEL
jgi:radical SAM protein with 4Fe4S-binding SPASM domain